MEGEKTGPKTMGSPICGYRFSVREILSMPNSIWYN